MSYLISKRFNSLNIRLCIVIILLLEEIKCIKYWSPALCEENDGVDCSSQLGVPYASRNSCMIYPTNICQTLKVASWPELKPLDFEEESTFKISLKPYVFTDNLPVSAFNFSIDTDNNDITGFFFFLLQEKYQSSMNHYNSCRVFDLSAAKALDPPLTSIHLYYECYKRLEKNGILEYDLVLRAVPINEELRYKVLVPNDSQIAPSELCDWAPLVMVNSMGLTKGTVELKFSNFKHSQLDHFLVRLVAREDNREWAEKVPTLLPPGEKMHYFRFDTIPQGGYHLSVAAVSNGSKFECVQDKVMDLLVTGYDEETNFQWLYATILCSLILAVPVIGYIIFKHCASKSRTDDPEILIPRVLVLYSYDCPEHMEVVLKFAEYLRTSCKMKIILDEWDMDNQDPSFWIPSSIQNTDFIVVIISKGVHHKMDNKNIPNMLERPWGDLFTPASRALMNHIHSGDNAHQIIKVLFDSYVKRHYVPKLLIPVGTMFSLMSQFNHFLCHLHNQTSRYFPVHIYPKMPGCDYLASPEGRALQDALEQMKNYQKENLLWLKTRLSDVGLQEEDGMNDQLGIPSNANSRAVSPTPSQNLNRQAKPEVLDPESCELLPK